MVRDRRTRSEAQHGLSPCFLYFRYRGSNLAAFPVHGAGENGHKLERVTNKQKEKKARFEGRTHTDIMYERIL